MPNFIEIGGVTRKPLVDLTRNDPQEVLYLWLGPPLRPRTHWQFYPTREPFANGSRRVARVHTLRPLRRVRPVHSDHIRMCSQWTRTVRVSLALQCECSSGRADASGRERRSVCACLQTDLFISNDSIHMTRKGGICHELSTCNWVTTGRKADTVCTRRSGRVSFASV